MDIKNYIAEGKAILGIEFGSTRIKGVLIDDEGTVLAVGGYEWENSLVNGIWTYGEDEFFAGLKGCYASLKNDVKEKYGISLTSFKSIGISGMMNGQNTLVLVLSMVTGGIIGTLLNLDAHLENLGNKIEARFKSDNSNAKIAEGFITPDNLKVIQKAIKFKKTIIIFSSIVLLTSFVLFSLICFPPLLRLHQCIPLVYLFYNIPLA